MLRIVAGLGNPSKDYQYTYHNIGALFINFLADSPWRSIARKHFVYSHKDGIILIKPTLFMNESGKSMKEVLSYFKAEPASLLVAHDDSDLMWGLYKLTFGQGAAGHKGVESIIQELGTKGFSRLRIGIRTKTRTHRGVRQKAGDFVLERIPKKHLAESDRIFLELKKEVEEARDINIVTRLR